MSDDPTAIVGGGAETATTTTPATTTETAEDQRVPYERFQQANRKAKEAADRAKKLETDMAELRAQMEERESAGLPELEQMRKRLEQAEKKAIEAENLAEERERQIALSRAERWVIAAAKDFVDPDDAVKNVNLAEIEDADQAEREVKRVAKAKKHLLRSEDPQLPGQVLRDGQRPVAKAAGGIDLDAEARAVSQELAKFLKNRG